MTVEGIARALAWLSLTFSFMWKPLKFPAIFGVLVLINQGVKCPIEFHLVQSKDSRAIKTMRMLWNSYHLNFGDSITRSIEDSWGCFILSPLIRGFLNQAVRTNHYPRQDVTLQDTSNAWTLLGFPYGCKRTTRHNPKYHRVDSNLSYAIF